MKNEFSLAFNEVIEEKQLPKEVIMEALEAAMVSAYRRAVNASNAQHVEAKIDSESGRVSIYAEKEVVEAVEDSRTEVSVTEAQKVDPEATIGSMVVVETTPRNFGRVAAQTARQVIQQRIREAERDAQFAHYSKQLGEIVSGMVQAVNNAGVTLGLDMKAEGIMPRNQQIPGERFRVHDRVRSLLLEIKTTPRGPQIILSRAHRNFLRRLLENEVPEIYHGMVEIRSIAREPGQRSKVAVAALQPGVDPVGACVGIRGVRIQAIVRELNDEKIDVIEWSADPAAYIAKALSPARVSGVYLNEQSKGAKTATVVVPEDQLSLAIGRDGQNARLAAKLTSWRIDIKSQPEAASDALFKIRNDPAYAAAAKIDEETIASVEVVLAKKAEGRPVTPEEYQVLTQFVDRIERGVLQQRQEEKQAEKEREKIAQANVPTGAFAIPLSDFKVSDRVYAVISEAGFETVGDLMLQMRMDSDVILRLPGMGPKGMQELEAALADLETQWKPEEALAEEAPEGISEVVESEAGPEAAEVEAEAELEEAAPVQMEEAVESPQAIEQAEVEEKPVAEPTVAALQEAEQAEVKEPELEAAPVAEEEGDLLGELLAMQADSGEFSDIEDEDEDESDDKSKKKGKKKKKKFVEVEYDPEKDVMLVKKKRKRGGLDDWDEGSW